MHESIMLRGVLLLVGLVALYVGRPTHRNALHICNRSLARFEFFCGVIAILAAIISA